MTTYWEPIDPDALPEMPHEHFGTSRSGEYLMTDSEDLLPPAVGRFVADGGRAWIEVYEGHEWEVIELSDVTHYAPLPEWRPGEEG